MLLKAGGRLSPGLRPDWFEGQQLVLEEPAKEGWWRCVPNPRDRRKGCWPRVGPHRCTPYIRKAARTEPNRLRTPRTEIGTKQCLEMVLAAVAALRQFAFDPELLQQFNTLRAERSGRARSSPSPPIPLADHPMHTERRHVPPRRWALPQATRRIAVGTTALRTLESLPSPLPTEVGREEPTC